MFRLLQRRPPQPRVASVRFNSTRKLNDKWNYNNSSLESLSNENTFNNFTRVTANDLESHKKPPKAVKMLVRDFIEDALYNPHYGYFPKQVQIFDTKGEPFRFGQFRDSAEFEEEVAKRYSVGEESDAKPGSVRPMWHTPTELFKPWYGQAIARCLVSEYLLKYFPYEDFIIYEIGAGNGSLAMDILDYIREEYPDVYDRTRYNIIEISGNLARLQKAKLNGRHPNVHVSHKSIFHWEAREPAPCFFLAMEVIDNFAHDVVRYDLRTLEPYQGLVAIDSEGDFIPFYTRITDPLISSFLSLRKQLLHPPPLNKLLKSSAIRNIFTSLPFASNLSVPEYIPSRLLSLLRTLRTHFPRHRILMSDFSSLPDSIPGINAPVVQTRYKNTTVPCSTLFVKQGHFDIFFPTSFERLRDMYEYMLSDNPPLSPSPSHSTAIDSNLHTGLRFSPLTTSASSLSLGSDFFSSHLPANRRIPRDGVNSASGLPVGERKSSVYTHKEFLETYADLSQTRLMNGENPMVDSYKNVKLLF